jgi:hypothetical protein
MPPFYIGSTSVENIINRNYRGSVKSKKYKKIWEQELKDNPSKFKTKIVYSYNDRQIILEKESKLQKCLNVVKSTLYINESFATKNGMFGRDVSNENNPMFGQGDKVKGCKNGRFGDNKTTFINCLGETLCTTPNDPRVISGEYKGIGTNAAKVRETKLKDPNLKKYKLIVIKTPTNEIVHLQWNEYNNFIRKYKLWNIISNMKYKGYEIIEKVLNPNCYLKQPIKKKKTNSLDLI